MNQVVVDRPQNIELPQPAPNYGCCGVIFKVVTTVANFFRTIDLWLVETASWLKDRAIDLFPEQTAMRLDPRRIFVRTVLGVAPDQRAAVLQHALPHISPHMDQNTREQLIQLVNDQNQSSSLSSSMLRFITANMYSPDSIEITAVIAAIPTEERDAVIIYADQLIIEEFNRLARRAIIEAITAIPAQEREAFVARARQLINDAMDGRTRQAIIQAIIARADRLITPAMSINSMRAIYQAVAAIPALEREEVIRNAVLLITPEMHSYYRIKMIQTVARVPVNERDTVIALALRVITPDMSEPTKRKIIEAITAVPASERVNVIEHAVQLINPQTHVYDRLMILRNVANASADQRANYLQQRRLGRNVRER